MYLGVEAGSNQKIEEREIRTICMRSREIFLEQPMMLELEAPVKICGRGWVRQATSTGSTATC
jgi:hypothetical protein